MAPAKPSPVEKPSSHSSPSSSSKPLGTPSSPGTSNTRRSPMSPTTAAAKATSKPDNSGQIHMTKPCQSVPDSTQKAEVHKPSAEVDTQPVVVSEGPQPLASPVNIQPALSDGKRPALPPPQSAPQKSHLVPAPSTGGPALTEPSSSVGCSPPTATAGIPTEGPPPPPVSESSLPVARGDPVEEKVSLGSTELAPNTASIQQEPQQQEMPRVEKATGHEVATVTEQGCIKKRKMPVHVDPREAKNLPEKPKAPSRRSSRAERDVEEGSTPQEAAENGQRKRSARPGSGSNAAARDTNTGASPNQAKRRKSK
ncbi:vegetative cell wall protein gp1-like [Acipenser oxyrinchus oxyrinchus]|uniref:Vegetative cell wall protein gp1-like n=1 Tax=Acipenser oxyrinchus oxyrinchus TaxID=40147 RepID=A0AAD8FY60_ACIOX|nr:vegetative cell wall protein gp1-like [Acipenser oxyrinchus oxyrinchus]